jgi:hypothetical protein
MSEMGLRPLRGGKLMVVIASSLYLVSTIAFFVMAIVIGMRLLALARRTGGKPERLLGWAFQLTAGWGYCVLIFSIIARAAMDAIDHPLGQAVTAIGWLAHNIGVVCWLRFNVSVFRPDSAWAKWLAIVMTAVLFSGWTYHIFSGGLATLAPSMGFWISVSVIGTYPIWTACEAFRYWGLMRRRMALGLAEPMLVDRFRVWGIGSVAATAAIWTVNLPSFLGLEHGTPAADDAAAVARLLTGCFGLITVGAYWLTFFPPEFYRRWIEGRGAVRE